MIEMVCTSEEDKEWQNFKNDTEMDFIGYEEIERS